MKKLSVSILALLFVALLCSMSFAAEVACTDAAARARTIETVSFITPYCYTTVSGTYPTGAYTAWYSVDLRLRNLTLTEVLEFDFMPDNQVISMLGGYDNVGGVWTPAPGGYSTIAGSVTIRGTAAVAFSNIIIQ